MESIGVKAGDYFEIGRLRSLKINEFPGRRWHRRQSQTGRRLLGGAYRLADGSGLRLRNRAGEWYFACAYGAEIVDKIKQNREEKIAGGAIS
jgi:hypothetical protein